MTEYSQNQIDAMFQELTSQPDISDMSKDAADAAFRSHVEELYDIAEHETEFNPYFPEAIRGIFDSFVADKNQPKFPVQPGAQGAVSRINIMQKREVTPEQVVSYIKQHEERLQTDLPQRAENLRRQAALEPEELEQLPDHLTDAHAVATEAAAIDPLSRLQVYEHSLGILCDTDYLEYQQKHPDFDLAAAVGIEMPSLEEQFQALDRPEH